MCVVAYLHEADMLRPARTLWVAMQRLASCVVIGLCWLIGGERVGAMGRDQDVQVKLIAEVSPGRVLLWYATG